jgi:peroxiredoxin
MKNKMMVALALLSLFLSGGRGISAEKSDASAELENLVARIQTKLKEGGKTEKDLADDLKEFEALLAKHQGEKTDAVAQILLMEAMVYLQVLDNTEKGTELIKQLKREFPDTQPGQNADKVLEQLRKQEEARKIQQTLVEGTKFPDFDEKDVAGKPVSVANYKGRVVLIDFWATWCGPCVAELPNVTKTYEKHHGEGFEIIGVSLDQDETRLTTFLKQKNITWQQFFDGKGWGNKLAAKYGVNSIPATYLLDGEGKIIAKNLRGETLEEAVAKALVRK